jgi:hypothetical protein
MDKAARAALLTPKLRAAILRGLPKFKRGGEVRSDHAIVDRAMQAIRGSS